MERTLVVLKPDSVQRQLVGEIIARFEQKGLKIVAMRMVTVSRDLARKIYAAHEGKDFFAPLIEFITTGPVVAMVLEGLGAVGVVRSMIGPTYGTEAAPGTIRGDFGLSQRYNLIHGSDSPESARSEIELFFSPNELMEYEMQDARWIYAGRGDQPV
jgi:nucleoside-diphosphate kinase